MCVYIYVCVCMCGPLRFLPSDSHHKPNTNNSHWDMLNYLPPALRHPFDFVVATFLADHLREVRKEGERAD